MMVISFFVLVVNGYLHFQNFIGVALLFCSYVGMWSKQLDHSFCWLTNKSDWQPTTKFQVTGDQQL